MSPGLGHHRHDIDPGLVYRKRSRQDQLEVMLLDEDGGVRGDKVHDVSVLANVPLRLGLLGKLDDRAARENRSNVVAQELEGRDVVREEGRDRVAV